MQLLPARVFRASGLAGLGAILVILALAIGASAASASAPRYSVVGGGGGSDSCNTYSDFYNDFANSQEVGISMHITCSNSGALIKGTIACIQEYEYGYGGVGSWHLGHCWAGQGYGSLVLSGFQSCYRTPASQPFRGEASFNVTFPDGTQETYSPVTAEVGIPCTLGPT